MGPPPNLNETEHKAWEWLVNEIGYDETDIRRSSADQTPDFDCPDESYEVKRPTAPGKFVVSARQKQKLDAADPKIIVFHEEEDDPRAFFQWSDRRDEGYVAQVYGATETLRLKCTKEAKNEIMSLFSRIDADASRQDVLLRIAAYLDDEDRLAEVRQAGSGKYR